MSRESFSFWQKAYLFTLVLFLAVLGICVFALADYTYGETVEETEKNCITEASYFRKALEAELSGTNDADASAICNRYADLCFDGHGAEISVMLDGDYIA
jgi:hypothetical protein